MTPLARAAAVLLALQVGHALDHIVNQPARDLALQVTAPGLAGTAASLVIVVLALRRRREAAPLAVLVGFGTAGGFVAVHLLPHWSGFSDPYEDLTLNAVSWAMLTLPMLAAVTVGALGLRELAARSVAAPAAVAGGR